MSQTLGHRYIAVLLKSESPIWFDFDNVSVSEQIAYSLKANHANTLVVDVGTVGRFKVLAVDQWLKLVALLLVVND